MSKVGNRRLLVLADYLDTLPRSSLNMGQWFRERRAKVDGDEGFVRAKKVDNKTSISADKIRDLTVNDCGFAACAVGHACSIPAFRKAGLKMTAHGNIGGYGDRDDLIAFGPEYKNSAGFNAVEDFFNLGNCDAYSLFGPTSYPEGVRPSTVANKIRRFVKENQD